MDRLLSDEEIESLGIVARAHFFDNILQAQDLHTAREIFDKLFEQFGWLQGEWKSPDRIMTISLRQWQEIKKEYGL